MTDQNRKTLRSFYCFDTLWSAFELQAQELGVSMDYLINESLRQFAETQGVGLPVSKNSAKPGITRPPSGFDRDSIEDGRRTHASLSRISPQNIPASPGQGRTNPAHLLTPAQQPSLQHQISQPIATHLIPPAAPRTSLPYTGNQAHSLPSSNQQPFAAPPPPPRPNSYSPDVVGWDSATAAPDYPNLPETAYPGPPGPPRVAYPQQNLQHPSASHLPSGITPLYLTFNNNRYVIGNQDFVIGRGSQRTDLTIRDGNISRRHCVILYRNGNHYIKDLGSTNGVEFQGNRIESKRISDGDVYMLCDYELRFSYR